MDDDSIDTRSFRPETKALLHTSYSLNKSLKSIHNTKSKSFQRDYVIHPKSSSQVSIADSSTATDLFSVDTDFQSTRHAMPLTDLDTFKRTCWDIFSFYSVKNDCRVVNINSFDNVTMLLPVQKLVMALSQIDDAIPKQHCVDSVKRMHYSNTSMISWADFREFSLLICSPFLPCLKKCSLERNASSPVLGQSRLTAGTSVSRSLDPQLRSYQRLVDMQRSVTANNPSYHHSSTGTFNSQSISTSVAQLEGNIVPSKERDEVVIHAITQENRQRRKERDIVSKSLVEKSSATQLNDDSQNDVPSVVQHGSFLDLSVATNSQRGGALESPSYQSLEDDGMHKQLANSLSSDFIEGQLIEDGSLLPGFALRLEKSKITSVVHPQYSYPVLWQKMKKIRDNREAADMKRLARSEMLSTLKTLIVSTEKDSFNDAVQHTRSHHKNLRVEMHNKYKEKENQMIDKINDFKVKESLRRSDMASSLKNTLKTSIQLSKLCIEDERRLKVSKKAPSLKLDDSSSSIVKIPSEFVDQKKSATRYTDYVDAKKKIKDYYENTISARINSLTKSKSVKYLPKLGEIPTLHSLSRSGSTNLPTSYTVVLEQPNSPPPKKGKQNKPKKNLKTLDDDSSVGSRNSEDDNYAKLLAKTAYLEAMSEIFEESQDLLHFRPRSPGTGSNSPHGSPLTIPRLEISSSPLNSNMAPDVDTSYSLPYFNFGREDIADSGRDSLVSITDSVDSSYFQDGPVDATLSNPWRKDHAYAIAHRNISLPI